jgi:Kef-type K+ transport system membrane component KefB
LELRISEDMTLFHTLLQIICVLLAANLFGRVARYLGEPRVIGEMVAGLVLGPSLLGYLAPNIFQHIFAANSLLPLAMLSQIGLILLMFQIGLEFDFGHLRAEENRRAISLIWLVGIGFPVILGVGFGWTSHTTFSPRVPLFTYALFMAVSLCITAMPVLGRIMMELKITRTRLGVLAITCAAFDDVVGWMLLAFVTALAQVNMDLFLCAIRLVALALFLGVTWYFVRPALRLLSSHVALSDSLLSFSLILAVLFCSGLMTQLIGIHSIFGGFWAGVLLHQETDFVAWWRQRAAGFVNLLFVPLFFTFTGLRTNLPGLNSPDLWAWCLLLVGLATLGKFGGCWWAARWAGLSPAEARCIAVLMNTRGLLELVVANVGYELKIIPQSIFTMLVFMAVLTTSFTTPCLRRWLPAISQLTGRNLGSPRHNPRTLTVRAGASEIAD